MREISDLFHTIIHQVHPGFIVVAVEVTIDSSALNVETTTTTFQIKMKLTASNSATTLAALTRCTRPRRST